MGNIKISGRYAKSLLDLAVEKKAVEAVYQDAIFFLGLTALRDFFLMMKSPVIKSDKKIKIFEALLNDKINALTMAFFRIVIQKGREQFLKEIMQELVSQYNVMKGITIVKFTSAVPVDDALSAKMEEVIAKNSSLKTIEWQKNINEDLIGGFVLEFDNKLFDASIAFDLKAVKKQFLDNIYVKKF